MIPPYTGKKRPNSMRHPTHDYTATGAYFVTICVHDRQPLFGCVADGDMHLSALGMIAGHCWHDVMANHSHVELDVYVIMPNHVHALLQILVEPRDQPAAAQRQFARPIAGSISTLVGRYKAEVSRRAKRADLAPAGKLWQRNFRDRIVRGQRELENVRAYIATDPQRWGTDRLCPGGRPKWHE
ncbi:MAG: transposase [Chloroflexota bacterium]|nr:transposase [Chloroflexota bacterium]